MGLLGSLMMLVLLLLLYLQWLPHVKAQTNTVNESSSISQAKALDVLLQEYAYKALKNPITGTIYDGDVPSNLTGIKVSALRLRSGSLRRKGVSMYKEFVIPKGVIARPYVKRLVLVYQNLGDLSTKYYQNLLPNYSYLAPVLGLLAYNGMDLSATNLQELDITVSRDPISVKFEGVNPAPDGAVAKCVWFNLQGVSNFSDVTEGNTCSTTQQGHFSIVVESTAPAPAPAPVSPPPPPGAGAPSPAPGGQGGGKKSKKKVWIIVGSVLGGLAFLLLLSLLILWVNKFKQKKKLQQMEREAEVGEALHMASVGETKAPAATGTRTQPTLEHEYAP